MPFTPQESLAVSWFRDGSEIKDGGGVKITREPNHSRLLLRDCLRTDAGEIKIQLKNPFGVVEATSQLIVLGRKRQTNITKQIFLILHLVIRWKTTQPFYLFCLIFGVVLLCFFRLFVFFVICSLNASSKRNATMPPFPSYSLHHQYDLNECPSSHTQFLASL